jgi:tRNA (cmo5U34)-methyltransferase
MVDFSFAEIAPDFDAHIDASIPGYGRLMWWCEKFSRRFVQNGTMVIDIGCSTGALLKRIRDANQPSRQSVHYLGIDIEKSFGQHWRERCQQNMRFEVQDALTFNGFENASLLVILFTLQFIPERQKIDLLRRVFDGLVEGGALIIAEKTLASCSALQELITFTYYDHKRQAFTAEQILNKESRLRGLMTPWTKAWLVETLHAAGFQAQDIESFWQEGPFIAYVGQKRTKPKLVRGLSARLPCNGAVDSRHVKKDQSTG